MRQNRPTVLVAEDERETVELYRRWFTGRYDLRVAYDGQTAVTELGDDVDVVLLDRSLPDLSGRDVLDRLHDSRLDCRVAIVSAAAPDYDIVESGFDDYLQKPVSREGLVNTVERLLRRAAYSRTLREFYALARQRAALEEAKRDEELADHPVYREVVADLEATRHRLDTWVDEFDYHEVRVALRDAVADPTPEVSGD